MAPPSPVRRSMGSKPSQLDLGSGGFGGKRTLRLLGRDPGRGFAGKLAFQRPPGSNRFNDCVSAMGNLVEAIPCSKQNVVLYISTDRIRAALAGWLGTSRREEKERRIVTVGATREAS